MSPWSGNDLPQVISTGLETLKLKTRAVRDGYSYNISGQKIWISSAQVASKMILLARTTPLQEVKKPSEGLSLFFIDFDRRAPGLELKKIRKMGSRAVDANEVFFDNYRVPADTLIGEEGQGFKIVRRQPGFLTVVWKLTAARFFTE